LLKGLETLPWVPQELLGSTEALGARKVGWSRGGILGWVLSEFPIKIPRFHCTPLDCFIPWISIHYHPSSTQIPGGEKQAS